MKTVLVTAKAKWNLQELIPVVLTGGLGLLGLFFGTTGTFTQSGSIITMVVGFGLTLLILNISFSRKRKSTLFANLGNDENLSIEVWMKKPIKDKWQGKMDKGKNKGNLDSLASIKMDSIRGTRVVVLYVDGGKKPLFIPTRLAEKDIIRKYLAQALEQLGGKLKFESKEDSIEFKALLTGATYFRPENLKDYEKVTKEVKTPVAKVAPVAAKTVESPKKAQQPLEAISKVTAPLLEPSEAPLIEEEVLEAEAVSEPQVVAEETTAEAEVAPKPKKKMGYGSYKQPDRILAVANATDKIGAEPEENEEDKYHSLNNGDALMGNLFGSGSSISIDLGNAKPSTEDK